MEDTHQFEIFLKQVDINAFVPTDSPLWPGFRILHVAVIVSETIKRLTLLDSISDNPEINRKEAYETCCREQEEVYLERIEICLKRGADANAQDVHGWTPIHLAFRHRKMQVVNLILQNQDKIANSVDKDNLSHLHIACIARNKSLVEKLLSDGADANVKVLPSFEWQSDFYKCTFNDVFSMIGSTPMHLAIADADIANMLLSSRGDSNIKDVHGLTPVHRSFILYSIWEIGNELFTWPHKEIGTFGHRGRHCLPHYFEVRRHLIEIGSKLLSSAESKESIVDKFGLSNLHIACLGNQSDAVNQLLDLGSDINVTIASEGYEKLDVDNPLTSLSRYAGFTPLHMLNDGGAQTEELLLQRGSDILAKLADGTTPLFKRLGREYRANIVNYVAILKKSEALRIRLQNDFGWTLLHVACTLIDYDSAKESLDSGADVNARTNADSPTYPGCTALHILMMNCDRTRDTRWGEENLQRIRRLLLDKGADLMITDEKGSTSVHRADFLPDCRIRSYEISEYTEPMLRHIKNFNVNPVNHEGMSVFHIACIRHEVAVVQRYLKIGVDVNEPTQFFGSRLNGCTPLHLAAKHLPKSFNNASRYVTLIGLLLKHGADVCAENSFGETPLHAAAECHSPEKAVLEMIFKAGAKMNAQNTYGKTPFEVLLRSHCNYSAKVMEFFLKNGCHANRFNPISQSGYIPMIFSINMRASTNSIFKMLLSCSSICGVDEMGRNALQNIVSSNDFYREDDMDIIEYFTKRGCDIDYQDKLGRTALHLAAQFRSNNNVEALLMHGADINIVDRDRKTAYSHTLEPESLCDMTDGDHHYHHRVIESFARYVHNMQLQGLYVSEINQQVHLTAMSQFNLRILEIKDSLQSMRDEKINSTSLKLGDFMSETSAIVRYPKIPSSERKKIKTFFTTTIKDHRFSNWRFVCQLQYRKALARLQLVKRARIALPVVLGFPLPDVCFDVLEQFLPNADLKNFIEASR